MNEFFNKNILITGTSKGIGKAIAEYFVSLGANVYGVSRSNSDINNKNYHHIIEDVRNTKSIIDYLLLNKASIDILINNAGIVNYRSIVEENYETIKETFDINVFSAFLLSKEITMNFFQKKKSGVIVNVLSFASIIPSAHSSVYAASKSALESFTKTMAAEFAPYGVRVNGISPGVINTEMNHERLMNNKQNLIDMIALNKIGEVNDIIKPIEFLVSNSSCYITGINLNVSGGKLIVQNVNNVWKENN